MVAPKLETKPFGLGTSSLMLDLLISGVLISLFYVLVAQPIYNIYFHPLRKFPGPKSWAAFRIPYTRSSTGGTLHLALRDLHRQYGDVVRIAPNELSYVRPDAWKHVMGHRKQGERENGKDPVTFANTLHSIIGSAREEHAQARRVLSHGFSAKRMLEQEPLIQKYIDLLFEKIAAVSAGGSKPIDMVAWYNYTTFDIIADLSFGDSFHCLDSLTMHPWVKLIFDSIKVSNMLTNLRHYYHSIDSFLRTFIPSSVAAREEHLEMIRQKVRQREAMKADRPDFFDSMTREDKTGNRFTSEQIEQNSEILLVAGSETTATVLSFVTYLLCKHPEVQEKAAREIKAAFQSQDEIDMTRVQSLEYTLAVLNETMRLYPAAPAELPRRTPPEGSMICDEFVPGDTIVMLPQYPSNRYPGNWAKPDDFVPERWLNDCDPIYQGDKKESFNPFSHGSRDCIGKNLAYAEMRVIVARMLFNYHMELDEQSRDWVKDLHTYTLWDKPPMYVNLKPRKVEA